MSLSKQEKKGLYQSLHLLLVSIIHGSDQSDIVTSKIVPSMFSHTQPKTVLGCPYTDVHLV